MANYDAKLMTAKGQAQILKVVKNAIDNVNVTATNAVPKVKNAVAQNLPALNTDGSIADSGVKIADLQKKIAGGVEGNIPTIDASGFVKDSGMKPGDFQKVDALLTALAAIVAGDGLLALNGVDSVEARKIVDTDIKATEALYYALKAFMAKNGSITMPKDIGILNDAGKVILKDNGSAIVIGEGDESIILKAQIVDGKAQVFVGSNDPTTRLTTKAEMDAYVANALTKDSDYRGIVTYMTTESTVAAAKALVEALDATKFNPGVVTSAIAYGDTTKEIFRGQYTGGAWTWTAETFNTGDWVYFAHVVSATHPLQDAGRAVWKEDATSKTFELMYDMTQIPDGIYMTDGPDGKLTITTKTIKGGTTVVPKAFGAWNLMVDENTTILDALNAKVQKFSITTVEPSATSLDDEVPSAKTLYGVLGNRSSLTTDTKDNHIAAINEVNSKGKTNAAAITDLHNNKMDKLSGIETASIDNITIIADKLGNVRDSGIKVTRIAELENSKITKIATPTAGALPTIDATGALVNSTTKLDDVNKVVAEAVRVQDIITDDDIAQLLKDSFGV